MNRVLYSGKVMDDTELRRVNCILQSTSNSIWQAVSNYSFQWNRARQQYYSAYATYTEGTESSNDELSTIYSTLNTIQQIEELKAQTGEAAEIAEQETERTETSADRDAANDVPFTEADAANEAQAIQDMIDAQEAAHEEYVNSLAQAAAEANQNAEEKAAAAQAAQSKADAANAAAKAANAANAAAQSAAKDANAAAKAAAKAANAADDDALVAASVANDARLEFEDKLDMHDVTGYIETRGGGAGENVGFDYNTGQFTPGTYTTNYGITYTVTDNGDGTVTIKTDAESITTTNNESGIHAAVERTEDEKNAAQKYAEIAKEIYEEKRAAADEANSAANKAQSKANSANSAANKAQSEATKANNAAKDANDAANKAQSEADAAKAAKEQADSALQEGLGNNDPAGTGNGGSSWSDPSYDPSEWEGF